MDGDGRKNCAGPFVSGGAERRLQSVNVYRIFLHDARNAEPIELAAEFGRDARAHEFAHERLASSPYYEAIEVWRGSVKLCHLRTALPQAA
jgi:hypothetical protein